MKGAYRAALLAAVAASTTALAEPAGPKATGPVAVYWMSAQTTSGFGMPGMGGGRPSAGAMMRMMMGGGMGQGPQHLLTLQLGSSRRPQGEPQAEHLPPQGLGVGESLPLVTPVSQPAPEAEPERPAIPQEFQRPRGRMLIFWGCGEHARPGQPLVIDFSQITPEAMRAGQIPPAMAALGRSFNVSRMQPPSSGRNTTYGEWPNGRTQVSVPGDGSLAGAHVVRGDYTPDIRFNLAPNQDFLAPLQMTANARTPTGASELGWNAVPNAQGYLATAIGGGQSETAVLWTSSEVQASAFSLPDYIGPPDIARLVASRALMAPQTTHCTVPKEVVDAAPQAFFQLVAYGPEANFVYPPRPADPKAVWNRQWEVKVRYRSSTSGLLGRDLGRMGREANGDGGRAGPGDQPPPDHDSRARSIMRGLGGGMIPGF